MKKLLAFVLTAVMLLAFAACGEKEPTGTPDISGGDVTNVPQDFKVGVILIGDETEGYTLAHMNGIKAAAQALGLAEDQIIWKYKVEENAACKDAAEELADDGCKIIFSNSYGHQTYMVQAAEEFEDVTFVSMTGDFAAICGLDNLKNAFTSVYESRYVSGVVAGLKVKELLDSKVLTPETTPNNFDGDGNVKIGYVGAYNYAEVVSGYTAFFLGIQSVVPNVVMEVNYTNSWFDIAKEGAAAEALMANGCVIIGQHADSTGAPAAVEKALKNGTTAYSVGYNIDMLPTAPTAALTSASNDWSVYYTYAIGAAMRGEEVVVDWAHGYDQGAVNITALGNSCAPGTAEYVEGVIAKLKSGELKVFDTDTFTVGGEKVTTNIVDLSYMDYSTMTPIYVGEKVETIVDGAFVESTFRSAPSFALLIDGIVEK